MWQIEICRTIDANKIFKKTFTYLPNILFSTYVTPTEPFFNALPMLHYRRICREMIMVFKIVTGVMDSMVSCNFIGSHSVTRGNRYKLKQKHVHYNLTKFSFANSCFYL